MRQPKLYTTLAEWWPLLSPVEEYADEAAFFLDVLSRHFAAHPSDQRHTLVEFGSGGGNNAEGAGAAVLGRSRCRLVGGMGAGRDVPVRSPW